MLDSMRKRKDNLFSTAIILAVVFVMIGFGVGQLAMDKPTPGVAAKVNDDIISKSDYDAAVDAQMAQYRSLLGGQFDEKFLLQFQIPQRTLEMMIQEKLKAQLAHRMKIVVPDQELAEYIKALPYFQKDGKFDADRYNKIPNRAHYEKQWREQMEVDKLRTYLADRVRLTPEELKRSYQLRETKVDLEYARIDFKELAKKQKPTPDQIEKHMKDTPEADLKAYYQAHLKDYSEPAAVSLRQIRVGIPFQASAAQKEEAKKKMEAIAKAVTPANFGEQAKAKSDDEYAKKGGVAGWVNRGTLEPAIETAIDRLQPGQVSEPVETNFGYFLLMVDKKKDGVTRDFALVKRGIAEKLLQEKLSVDLADKMKADWNKLLAEGKPLDGEIKKAKVEIKKTGPFALGQGSIPNIGQADGILDAVFTLSKANPTPKELLPFMENYYYVKLLTLEPAKEAEFAKNAETIEKSVSTSIQSTLMSEWVESLQKESKVVTSIRFDTQNPTAIQ